jgi:hypothetical protein
MAKKTNIIRRKVAAKKAPSRKKAAVKPTTKAVKKTIKALAKTASVKKEKKALAKKAPIKKTKKPAKRKPETLMCFLTTACVHYYSLPDDGYELNTLRKYRDTYLANSKGGEKIIADYYRVSPEIVKRVNKDENKTMVYEYIYSQVIAACSEIENQKSISAKNIYTNLVKTLMKKYQLN